MSKLFLRISSDDTSGKEFTLVKWNPWYQWNSLKFHCHSRLTSSALSSDTKHGCTFVYFHEYANAIMIFIIGWMDLSNCIINYIRKPATNDNIGMESAYLCFKRFPFCFNNFDHRMKGQRLRLNLVLILVVIISSGGNMIDFVGLKG